jgi:maltooligosyltrehalose trehalohydrolase
VWAPLHRAVQLELVDPRADAGRSGHAAGHAGTHQLIEMQKDRFGYFHADVADVGDGVSYQYRIDEAAFPDPASAYQPEGVSGPSAVVDHRLFVWSDSGWNPPPFAELIIYEIHVGTFTAEGSFDAAIGRLDELVSLGINAIELMPVAAFSGQRNWGYDGAFLYAVAHVYGGPIGLKRLVDACHARGIAVFLDVVYNHIGREGNCLEAFGRYFTDQYRTPWGKAINYDGAWSDGVREYIIGNALYWAEHYHLDGLRLDAIHEIYDRNAITIWEELYTAVREWEERSGRRLYLMAESDSNDPRVVRPPQSGGRGFDAQWMDDFHHSLYVLLDPAGAKHYQDFGPLELLARIWTQGFAHTGEYLHFRHRRHGASSAGVPGECFIVFNQNHDLPGNRPGGERLSSLVGPGTLKLAAAALLLSPYVPMLFMGEEYGEDNPFFFFSDYQDPATTRGLLEGRREQFAAFNFEGEVRDPQDPVLFERSKLCWEKRLTGDHRVLARWHRDLIALRRTHPLLADLSKRWSRADVVGLFGLSVYRYSATGDQHLVCLFNFSHTESAAFTLGYAVAQGGTWDLLLASDGATGPGGTSDAAGIPGSIAAGGAVLVPPQGLAVYELNPSPGSPAPAAG